MQQNSFLNPKATVAKAGLLDGQRVADFSGGAGFFARAAARAVGEGGVVWFVDPNQDLLVRVKNLALGEGLHNVEVVRGSVEKKEGSKLPAASVDLVIIANLLFTSEKKADIAAEALRVLRRGGKVLVLDWKDSFGGLGPAPEHVVPLGAARALFEEHSLVFVQEIPAGAYHWGCILQKKG